MALFHRLVKKFNLKANSAAVEMKYMGDYDKSGSYESQAKSFSEKLKILTPGTWLFLEHPAYDCPEMRGIYHAGYEDVGKDRENVPRIFTSPEVKKVIEAMNIKLISYRDL